MPGTSLVRWGGPLCGAHLFVTQGPVGTQRVQPRQKRKKRDRHPPRWLRVGFSTSTFPKYSLNISHKAYSLPDTQNLFCRICIFLFPSAGFLPNIFTWQLIGSVILQWLLLQTSWGGLLFLSLQLQLIVTVVLPPAPPVWEEKDGAWRRGCRLGWLQFDFPITQPGSRPHCKRGWMLRPEGCTVDSWFWCELDWSAKEDTISPLHWDAEDISYFSMR